MSKALFKLERKSMLKFLLIFATITALLSFVTMALYPVLQEILAELSTKDLGVDLEQFIQMGSITDYFTSNMFQMWGLLSIIYASVLAVKLTSGSFKDKSFELVYTLNISRVTIIRTKLIRLVLNILWFNLIAGVGAYIGLAVFAGVSTFSTLNFLVYFLISLVVTLISGLLAFALGLFAKHKFSTAAGVVLAVLFYFIVTAEQVSMTSWIGYLSPLTSLSKNIIAYGFVALKDTWISLCVWVILVITMLIASIFKFKNDDLC